MYFRYEEVYSYRTLILTGLYMFCLICSVIFCVNVIIEKATIKKAAKKNAQLLMHLSIMLYLVVCFLQLISPPREFIAYTYVRFVLMVLATLSLIVFLLSRVYVKLNQIGLIVTIYLFITVSTIAILSQSSFMQVFTGEQATPLLLMLSQSIVVSISYIRNREGFLQNARQTVLDDIEDAILILNEGGRVIYSNGNGILQETGRVESFNVFKERLLLLSEQNENSLLRQELSNTNKKLAGEFKLSIPIKADESQKRSQATKARDYNSQRRAEGAAAGEGYKERYYHYNIESLQKVSKSRFSKRTKLGTIILIAEITEYRALINNLQLKRLYYTERNQQFKEQEKVLNAIIREEEIDKQLKGIADIIKEQLIEAQSVLIASKLIIEKDKHLAKERLGFAKESLRKHLNQIREMVSMLKG